MSIVFFGSEMLDYVRSAFSYVALVLSWAKSTFPEMCLQARLAIDA